MIELYFDNFRGGGRRVRPLKSTTNFGDKIRSSTYVQTNKHKNRQGLQAYAYAIKKKRIVKYNSIR